MVNKKLISVLLALTLVFSLVACGNTETTTSNEGSESTQSAQETTKAEKPSQELQEKVFVDDENCTFKITEIEPDGFMGYTLKAYVENKTDKNLMFSWEDVSVNGFMCDPFWATSVQAGKKSKEEISFSTSEFEELGIEDVEDIEFTLLVYDDDDWEAPRLVEETFTLNINE